VRALYELHVRSRARQSGLYISVDGSRYLGSWRDGRRQGYARAQQDRRSAHCVRRSEGLCRLPDGSFYAGGWDDDAMTAGSLRLPNGRVQQVMWDSDAGEWRIVGEQRDRSTASAAVCGLRVSNARADVCVCVCVCV
jgi:hypothetical protein